MPTPKKVPAVKKPARRAQRKRSEAAKPKGNVGQRTTQRLTPETQKIIVDALTLGVYVETACGLAGIEPMTFYRWLRRGQQNDGKSFVDFRMAVLKAMAGAEYSNVVTVRTAAARGEWRASAWLLERRWGDRWRSKDGANKDEEASIPREREVPIDDESRGILDQFFLILNGAANDKASGQI